MSTRTVAAETLAQTHAPFIWTLAYGGYRVWCACDDEGLDGSTESYAQHFAAEAEKAIRARIEQELREEFAQMADVWGGPASWLTTGTQVADLAGEVAAQVARGGDEL